MNASLTRLTLRCIALMVLLPGVLAARAGPDDGPTIAITPGSTEPVQTRPGRVVTLVFRVENLLTTTQHIDSRVDLSSGWRLLTPPGDYDLEGHSSEIRLVSFYVPASAAPGDHTITYRARIAGRELNEVRSTRIVTVEPVELVRIDVLSAPGFLAAGQTDTVAFAVSNDGNLPLPVSISVRTSGGLLAHHSHDRTIVPAQSTARVLLDITSPDALNEARAGRLQIRALAGSHNTVSADATTLIQLVPIEAGRADNGRLPARITLYGVGNENGVGAQALLAGRGKMGGGEVDFEFTAPDQQRASLFGRRSIYRMRYHSDPLRINLGDNIYSLSPLTEAGRLGFGAGARHQAGRLKLAGFVQHARYSLLPDRQVAAQASYSVLANLDVGAAAMRRRGTFAGEVYSVRTLYRLNKMSELDAECGVETGTGVSRPACNFEAQGRWSVVSYNARLFHTGPDFPGFTRDLTTRSAGLGVQARDWLRLQASWLDQSRGLGEGFSRDYRVARAGAILNGRPRDLPATLFIFYQHRDLTYDNASPSRYLQHAVRTRASYDWSAIGVVAGIELGRTTTRTGRGPFRRAELELSLRPLEGHVFSASAEYSSGAFDYWTYSQRRWLLNLNASSQLSTRTRARASLFGSIDRGFIRQTYGSVRLEFEHELRTGHRLGFRVQHTDLMGFHSGRSTDYSIAYSVPIGLPRALGKTTRRISGRVVDSQTHRGIQGALLYLGSSTTVTRADGSFSFNVPPNETLYLRLDRPSAGLDRVPTVRMPLEISPGTTDTDHLEIPLARAGRVAGGIVRSGEDQISPSVNVSMVLVELTNGRDRYRTLTDRDGRFSLEDIYPGDWTVSLRHTTLERGHFVDRESIPIPVRSDSTSTADFVIRARRQPQRVVDRGVLTLRHQPDDVADRKPEPGAEGSKPAESAHLPFSVVETAADTDRLHEVAPGETLSDIAHLYYGSAHQWTRIFNANRETMTNPDLIRSGWKLTIPPGED